MTVVAYIKAVIVAVLSLNFEPSYTTDPDNNHDKNLLEFVQSAMDTSVDPCEDFNRFVCGSWMNNVSSGDHPATYSTSVIYQAAKDNKKRILPLIKNINVESYGPTSFRWKLRSSLDLCIAFANGDKQETTKTYLSKLVESIGGWELIDVDASKLEDQDHSSTLAEMLGRVANAFPFGFNPFFMLFESDGYITIVPNRQFTLLSLGNMTSIYNHITGSPPDDDILIRLNSSLPKVNEVSTVLSNTMPSERVPLAPHRMSELYLMQGFDWKLFFSSLSKGYATMHPEMEVVSTHDLSHMTAAFATLSKSFDSSTLYDYIMVVTFQHYIEQYISSTNNATVEEVEEHCSNTLDKSMIMATTRLLEEQAIPERSLPILSTYTEAIVEQYRDIISAVPYLDINTVTRLLDKLNVLSYRLIFPSLELQDYAFDEYYAQLTIGKSWLGVLESLTKFVNQRVLEGVTRPWQVKSDFGKSAASVNAFYSPLDNSIITQAGILMKPFFHPDNPFIYNFAFIGFIIGHEIGHVFSPKNLELIWSGKRVPIEENAALHMAEEQKCLVNMYDELCEEYGNETVCVNGLRTLNENIADQLGIKATYRAFHDLAKRRRLPTLLPGFDEYTTDQQFFILVARSLCGYFERDAAKKYVATNTHTMFGLRTEGLIKNFIPFNQAFNCKSGQPYKPERTCAVFGQVK